ncbi:MULTISPECIES: cupin domain-containing protein [Hydrogenophaga]|uniref:Cupin type-2 domain-containing protein n=1 Tax=Hydrogenophaga intermedia TaxID=65786 RepID=A0A1L1PV42_HYDIT|nr:MULTISPECIES: cupin domain-containing protein [Hydrogenophaga]AOS81610.1 cupin [Hydrogenophaga sp. PBC]TMU71125.1 cupin domain-containing protein [Hydrogenophaga intermedia]CDN89185.1 hypothetical protein BN948_03622 [Hydrogenophaga intermedia]
MRHPLRSRTASRFALAIALPALMLAPASRAQTAPPDPIVAALFTQALADAPGKEVLMLKVTYPPGGADPVHRHDAHGFIYVLDGEIVMGVRGGQEVHLKPGETFYEGPHDVHTVGRNASQTRPASFVVMLIKQQGVQPVLPAQ